MKYFNLEYETPIVIYGAGNRGQIFHHNLEKSGFTNIKYFLDENAEKIGKALGKIVVLPKSEQITYVEKSNTVVVISVTNVFQHNEIATMLFSEGYKNIIFKNLNNEKPDQGAQVINDIFDNILDMKYYQNHLKPVYNIPMFDAISGTKRLNNSILREIDNDYLVATVPIELIFSLDSKSKLTHYETKNLEEKYGLTETSDAPFFCVSPQISLFNYFNTNDQNELDRYINIIKFNYEIIDKQISEEEIERIISSREEVYLEMNRLLSEQPGFFSENPIKLKWNKKGYFNILDGKHRLAFFIEKGLETIPAKISREDYNHWVNLTIFKKIKSLQSKIIFSNPLHPNIIIPGNVSHHLFMTIYSLTNILVKNNQNYKKLRAICVGSNTIYFFQYFHKMGLQVELSLLVGEDGEEVKLLNKLAYIDGQLVNPLNCDRYNKSKDDNIIFVSFVANKSLSELLDKIINVIVSNNSKYLVVLCNFENHVGLISKLENINFNLHTQLTVSHTGKGKLISFLFYKNKS